MKTSAAFVAALLLAAAEGVHAQDAKIGGQLYEQHCGSCHGSRAGGDGWLSKYLTRTPPALNGLSKSFGGRFPAELVRSIVDGRRQVAMHGPRDMPVWGDVFRMVYSDRTVLPPSASPTEPPHFPPPHSAEAYAQQNIQSLVRYLEEIQH
jgi:mono/diheme cytochrome c family protein